jgi:hypothetical protein
VDTFTASIPVSFVRIGPLLVEVASTVCIVVVCFVYAESLDFS